jgi:hypothetical protein
MATGDITLTVVGIFTQQTIKAGVDGQNVGTQDAASQTATIKYVPLEHGQILVLKEARSA